MALSSIAGISNLELWDMARSTSPNFRSHTSKGTKALFTEQGYEAIKLAGTQVLNEYFDISMRIAFQMFTFANVRNPLESSGLVQVYNTPNGAYTQRIAVSQIKPITPKYRNLQEGQSIDPYTVRKPETAERFFGRNFDYQNLVSIQDFQMKTLFLSEYGVGEYLAGVLKQLSNSYEIQKYTNILEVINAAINSTTYPLQDSQVYNVDIAADTIEGATADESKQFLLTAKNVASALNDVPTSTAFNSAKFNTHIDVSDTTLLMRSGFKNLIDTSLLVGAFNPEYLNLPFGNIVTTPSFGGLIPYADSAFTTQVYEVYDSFGAVIGYSATQNSTTVTYTEDQVYWRDPNADIIGVIFQNGALFESIQNGYEVVPWYNPAGLYTNYWCSSPNNGIHYDYYYGLIVIRKTPTATPVEPVEPTNVKAKSK